MEFTVRNANLEDLEAIVELDKEAFSKYGTHEDAYIFKSRILSNPKGCFVLEIHGDVRGYITTEQWETLRDPLMGELAENTHIAGGEVVNITGLAISKDLQNNGYGRILLNKVIQTAISNGCTKIIVQTSHAQKFYEDNGFSLLQKHNPREKVGMSIYIKDLLSNF